MQATVTEKDILEALPTKKETIDIMWRTGILSKKTTQKLGDFEKQYLYDPVSTKAFMR